MAGRQLAQLSQYTLPSNGLELNLGNSRGWLSVVVDTVAGQATGTGIVVVIQGKGVFQTFNVSYGSPALTIPFNANLIRVTGTGAVIELLADTDYVKVSPIVLPQVGLVGTAEVDVKTVAGATPNLAKETGGNLASAATSSGAVAGLIYAPGSPPGSQLAVGVIDPAQQNVSTGKGIPVKSET